MKKPKTKKQELKTKKGFVALFVAILVLVIMIGIGTSLTVLTVSEQKISVNIVKSNQAYYAAEAGVEDALLRLTKSINWSSTYKFRVGDGLATTIISNVIGGVRTITSEGDLLNRIRKIQAVYQITADYVSFHYGVQAGSLGLQMNGNAEVHGNIFSNGTINGDSNTKIYGDTISAGPNGKIKNVHVKSSEGGGNAWAEYCENSTIDESLNYTIDVNCTAKAKYYHAPTDYVETEDMSITQGQISEWQKDAADGGAISGYSLGGNNKASLGPIKVNGNMTIDSNAILTVTGTIWVTGNLALNSNVAVQLASGYGSLSGVIVVDGKITIDSNVTLCGSEGYKGGQKCNLSIGSYLLLLSTKSSSDPNNPAILATSNTKTAILYSSAGFIRLSSNAALKEATGYGIYMDSNAKVTYEVGLVNPLFSSGPGGSWEVTSWKEIE
jgi:Tfp pilus assembly protein PilX